MKVACWNTQWHRSSSSQGGEILARIEAATPEIVCCPEAHENFLSGAWHGIFSHPDTGYPIKPGRRKVTLWSRRPWYSVDCFGSADLPPGRFVRAATGTTLGPVDVIGICIPWSDAHVAGGRRDRQRWEDHLRYLRALSLLLQNAAQGPIILIGDFNQAVPRRRAPARVYEELLRTLADLKVWSQGQISGLDAFPVCHIAGSDHLMPTRVSGLSRWHDGRPLSDHDGLIVDLALR